METEIADAAQAAKCIPIYAVGEMADLTRKFDWSRISLGPIERWPEMLVVLVNTILNSRQPMFLFWGEEKVQFYTTRTGQAWAWGSTPARSVSAQKIAGLRYGPQSVRRSRR